VSNRAKPLPFARRGGRERIFPYALCLFPVDSIPWAYTEAGGPCSSSVAAELALPRRAAARIARGQRRLSEAV